MSKLDLARATAYKHLGRWIDKFKDGYSKYPEAADYMLAMEIILKNGEARKAYPEEYQAALILEEVLAIEACLECGEAKVIHDGVPMLDILYKILNRKMAALKELESNNYKKMLASSGGKARSEKDPKQKEKAFVKECWNEWKKVPSKYKSKAAFARDMLEKSEELTSTKVIEDWCREWEKETKI